MKSDLKVAQFRDVLREVPLFAELDEESLGALAAVASVRRFPKGAVVFLEHDPGDALYVVMSGSVKIQRVGEDGRETTLALLDTGSAFGEMALLDGEPRSAVAETLESAELLVIQRADVIRLFSETPAMALAVIRVLSHRLRRANAQLMDLVFRDVRSRLAKLLVQLAEEHGVETAAGRRIGFKLTHQELANMVGTSRESVTRTLADMQDHKLIGFEGRYVLVLDLEGLARLAE